MSLSNGATEIVVNDFLARAAVPCAKDKAGKECPICMEDFAVNQPSGRESHTNPEAPEQAVIIRVPGSKCQHVFGHRCLEAHLRSGLESWNKCPLCRKAWFEVWNPMERELQEHEMTITHPPPFLAEDNLWYASKFDLGLMGDDEDFEDAYMDFGPAFGGVHGGGYAGGHGGGYGGGYGGRYGGPGGPGYGGGYGAGYGGHGYGGGHGRGYGGRRYGGGHGGGYGGRGYGGGFGNMYHGGYYYEHQ